MKKKISLFLVVLLSWPMTHAMIIKSQIKRPRAVQKKVGPGTYVSLDLKENNIQFTKKDKAFCRSQLTREKKTLTYSCSFKLPSTSVSSELSELRTTPTVFVKHGQIQKEVKYVVDKNLQKIDFIVQFDPGAFDMNFSEFNEEGFKVYDEMAAQILEKAVSRTKIQYTSLQN